MNIEILGIRDPGVTNRERLVLKVLSDVDIGYYVVFDTTFTESGGVSNKVRHSYWFPDKKVQAGDLVILYTKTGAQREIYNSDSSTSHFFYMGLDKTIWNKQKDCVVLLEARNWNAKGAY